MTTAVDNGLTELATALTHCCPVFLQCVVLLFAALLAVAGSFSCRVPCDYVIPGIYQKHRNEFIWTSSTDITYLWFRYQLVVPCLISCYRFIFV